MNKKINIYNQSELDKIKWMCRDVYITADKQVFNIYTLNRMNERLVNGCYGYTIDGKFRTKKWINEHCVNVEGMVTL